MARRKPKNYEPCPVARALDMVGDRWSLLVVRDAFDGTCRFGDFQRSLGVARNILSGRLRKLVDAGILKTQPASDGTAYLEYVLTSQGKHLFPLVVALRQWGEQHLFGRSERHSRLLEKATGKPVSLMTPFGSDGRLLLPDAAYVQKID